MEQTEIPTFAELAADPEIAPLLDFTPVPRQIKRPNGWTPELQRELIARIAAAGTLQQAVWQMGKHATGAEGLYRNADAAEFRASWDAAIAIGRRRNGLDGGRPFGGQVPGITRRSGGSDDGLARDINGKVRLPGQVLNEHGEWEDEYSIRARADDAGDRIVDRLLRIRRQYLAEISDSPGKRAAFDILTELPIDWDKAAKGEPQPDEPYRNANQRRPDMVLLAESGWSFGELGYGPDRKAEARAAMDAYQAGHGLPPIEWDGDDG